MQSCLIPIHVTSVGRPFLCDGLHLERQPVPLHEDLPHAVQSRSTGPHDRTCSLSRRNIGSFLRAMFKTAERPQFLRKLYVESGFGPAEVDWNGELRADDLPPPVQRAIPSSRSGGGVRVPSGYETTIPVLVKILQGAHNCRVSRSYL